MLPDIHLSEGAHISHTRHVNREVPEKVHNVCCLVAQIEIQDERGYQGTQKLINNKHLWAEKVRSQL